MNPMRRVQLYLSSSVVLAVMVGFCLFSYAINEDMQRAYKVAVREAKVTKHYSGVSYTLDEEVPTKSIAIIYQGKCEIDTEGNIELEPGVTQPQCLKALAAGITKSFTDNAKRCEAEKKMIMDEWEKTLDLLEHKRPSYKPTKPHTVVDTMNVSMVGSICYR